MVEVIWARLARAGATVTVMHTRYMVSRQMSRAVTLSRVLSQPIVTGISLAICYGDDSTYRNH